jgi:hypothetical protein
LGGAGGAAGNSIVTNGNTLTFSGLVGDIQGPQI